MAHTCLAVLLGALLLSLAADGAAQPEVSVQEFGSYRVASGSQGLEVRRASTRPAASVAAAAGAVLLLAAAGLASRGAAPSAIVGGVGALLLAFAGWVSLERAVWHANASSLTREGFAGRSESWPVADIDALEVGERRLTGAETKRSGVERWEVRVRLRDGSSVGPSFRLDTRADASALARAVGEALGTPVR